VPTPQSDIWALGCIGYEMCIAQQLSHGRNREPISTFIAGKPLDLSHLDSRFSDHVKYIIEQCLQREPTDRCTAQQLIDYIENL
jgi:serine/threonine protein kinase